MILLTRYLGKIPAVDINPNDNISVFVSFIYCFKMMDLKQNMMLSMKIKGVLTSTGKKFATLLCITLQKAQGQTLNRYAI